MKASHRLRLLLLLPVATVVLLATVVVLLSLHNIRGHFAASGAAQHADLEVIARMADFSRRINEVHNATISALRGAMADNLDELQLYRQHRNIVDELEQLDSLVQQLTGSELMISANHNSARELQEEFRAYRHFVIMATDVIAVDPQVADEFISQAAAHFREFSLYTSIVSGRLAERSQVRTTEQNALVNNALWQVLITGLLSLLLLFTVAFLVARRASTQILQIADALTTLSRSEQQEIPLPQIEAMQHGQGELAGIAGTLLKFRNAIERQRAAEQKAFELAFYDPVTGLPNRRLLAEHLEHALALGQKNNTWTALLLLDLDGFKTINDLHGHRFGDQLLAEVTGRFTAQLQDHGTLACLGGDQFVLLLDGLNGNSRDAALQARQLAKELAGCLQAPVQLQDITLYISASIGISMIQQPPELPEQPLQFAEAAMYQAKTEGRGIIRFHDAGIQQRLEERAFMELELRQAAERDELVLYYQPQVGNNDKVDGAEVLLRWQHPQRGLIPPMDFIPLAEETGLIIGIGQWVLEQACAQLARWQQDPALAELSLAVNVSARQFSEAGFVQQVADILHATGANPHRLKLELTESTLLHNMEDTIARMQELQQLGVQFSLDDFGTGYASLQYLQRLPLDQLKIDRSFVQGLLSGDSDPAIVRAIIAMGQALHLEVIAEGVEERSQQQNLALLGCSHYQGYLFSAPVPLAHFEQWCLQHHNASQPA
ncbi:EAL domain-containing protein [Oceanospirillaceae bacterium ASx5O]|nr:EAL domain-containing protein [Oceanospirillaceae bacterium ASx5O]